MLRAVINTPFILQHLEVGLQMGFYCRSCACHMFESTRYQIWDLGARNSSYGMREADIGGRLYRRSTLLLIVLRALLGRHVD